MQLCPNCQRRLISHASARCNWCGAVITDPDYQAKAAVNRESYWAQQQLHDWRALSWQRNLTGIGTFGDPLFGVPIVTAPIASMQGMLPVASARRAALRAQQMPSQQPSTSTESDAVDETEVPSYYRRRP